MVTPEERLAALLAKYPPSDEEPAVDNVALVEQSRYDGSYFVTTHESFGQAADYRTRQEYPEDWRFVTCVALATGMVFDEHVTVEYRPTVTTFPEGEGP